MFKCDNIFGRSEVNKSTVMSESSSPKKSNIVWSNMATCHESFPGVAH